MSVKCHLPMKPFVDGCLLYQIISRKDDINLRPSTLQRRRRRHASPQKQTFELEKSQMKSFENSISTQLLQSKDD